MTDARLNADASPVRTSTVERHWRIWLSLIVLLAAALRIYGLGRLSIWYDESTSLFALQYVDMELSFLKAEETRLIPLNTLLLFVWYGVVQAIPGVEMGTRLSDALLHVLPGTLSLLAVPLVFALGRRITGSAAPGLAGAFLAAISPFQLYYASELGPHSLYALMVLCAAYCNYRALEENKPRHWIGSIVFETLSFYAYYFSVFYLAAVNLFVLFHLITYRRVLFRWIASQAVAGLLVLPAVLLAMFVFRVHASAREHWFPFPTLKTLGITLKSWFAGYSPQPLLYWPLLGLGIMLFAAGAWALRRRPRHLWFLLFGAFAPLVMQWIFWNTQNFAFYTLRIQLAYSLLGFVLAGVGLSAIRPRALQGAAIALIAALIAPALLDEYAQRIHPVFHHRLGARFKVDNRGAAAFIREGWREGDRVAHASTVTLGPFKYHYLRDAAQSFVGFGEEEWQAHLRNYPDINVWESLGFVPKPVDDFTRDASRIWYVSAAWEPLEFFELGISLREWLDAHAVRVSETHLAGVDVYCYEFSEQAGPPAVNRVADLGWYTALAAPSAAAALALPEARDPAGLDVSFAPFAAGDFTGPEVTEDALHFRVYSRNRSNVRRPIEVRVRAAERVYAAFALDRERPSEVWRPVQGHWSKTSYLARLSAVDDAASLTGPIETLGDCDVYVERERLAPNPKIAAGDLRVEIRTVLGQTIPIGRIGGSEGEGWQWRRVGRAPALATGASVILTAESGGDHVSALVHVDKIAFVAPEHSAGGQWAVVDEARAELEPLSENVLDLVVPASAVRGGSAALLFECIDSEYNVYRSLLWHVTPELRVGTDSQ